MQGMDSCEVLLRSFFHMNGTDPLGHCSKRRRNVDANPLAPELFFLILAHPVYKMWIIQEQNTLELWNKLHFEEEKMESIHHV